MTRITIPIPPKPRIVIETVDSQTLVRLKGACYFVGKKNTSGGAVGTFCDGESSDQDGVKNGSVLTPPLEPDATYVVHETTPPAGYRVAPDKEVTTVAGENSTVTFKNRRVR